MARALPANANDIQKIYRTRYLVVNYKNLSNQIRSFQHDVLACKTREIAKRNDFLAHWQIDDAETSACS